MLNWKEWRPHAKWVFVKADERVKKTKGGIILTDELTGVEKVMEGSGRLLKVGSEVRDTIGYPVEPGMRIMYRGFLKDAFQDFGKEDDCDIFMLRAEDLLCVIEDDETKVGFFS